MSQKMGISAEGYQEWDFIMQHAGSSMDALQASMKTLASAAETGSDAFERLGISQEQIAEMSQEELFDATIAALQNVQDETERTYLTGQLLGRGATELGALLNMSADDVAELKQQVHDLGGVMSDEAVSAAAEYKDNLQNLTVAFDGIKRSLVSDFMPAFSTVMQGLTAFLTGDEGGVDAMVGGLNQILSNISEKIPQVAELGVQLVSGLADGLLEALPRIFETGGDIIKQLITSIIRLAPKFVETAFTIITSIANGLRRNMSVIVRSVTEGIISIASTILDNLPELLTAVLDIITSLSDALINEGLPLLLDALPELIIGVVNFILGAIPQILDAVMAIIDGIVAALPTIIQMIVQMIPQIIQGVIFAILDHLPDIIDAGIELLGSLLSNTPVIIMEIVKAIPKIIMGIIEALTSPEMVQKLMDTGGKLLEKLMNGLTDFGTKIWDACKKIFDAIGGAFSDLWESIKKIGKNVVEGIWEGIKGGADWIWNKVKEWFGGLFSRIKDFLGIASPSKLFRDVIGKNIVLGLAEGIDDNADTAIDSMLDLAGELTEAAEIGNVSYGGSFDAIRHGGTGGIGGGVRITQNIYAERMTPAQVFDEAVNAQERLVFLGLA